MHNSSLELLQALRRDMKQARNKRRKITQIFLVLLSHLFDQDFFNSRRFGCGFSNDDGFREGWLLRG